VIGVALAGADGDGVADGDAAEEDAADGDAADKEADTVADGEALPEDDGRATGEDSVPDGEATGEGGVTAADDDPAAVGVPLPAEALWVVTGCAELPDDTGLHPVAASAVAARTAATAVPRHHRSRIVKPPRAALLTGDAITGFPASVTFHAKPV
jgi:hypothetical protein